MYKFNTDPNESVDMDEVEKIQQENDNDEEPEDDEFDDEDDDEEEPLTEE
jgi:hypothetical protein